MSWWDYRNVGVSARADCARHVDKILDYIGFGRRPDNSAGDSDCCSFSKPEIYRCQDSSRLGLRGHIRAAFSALSETELLELLNALFPNTKLYVHSAAGNTAEGSWESHDRVYDTDTMTLTCTDVYTDIGENGPNGFQRWKERFALRSPGREYVRALAQLSRADGNAELTALLSALAQRLDAGEVIFTDDPTDTRAIGEEYDVEVEGDLDRWAGFDGGC